MSKFPLIVFEGIDGTGKTYHINKVKKYLKKKKIKFVSIREPGGSKNSEKIRKLLLSKRNNFHKLSDLFLYIASRNENVELIKKTVKSKLVLIDRFVDSTIAYQHYGQKINYNLINLFHKLILKNIKITHTFLHTINRKNLNLRLKFKKKDRYDSFNLNFYHRVQKGYLKLTKKNLEKYTIVNSNLSKKNNENLIKNKINKILKI